MHSNDITDENQKRDKFVFPEAKLAGRKIEAYNHLIHVKE
jgi:hypothetical protein